MCVWCRWSSVRETRQAERRNEAMAARSLKRLPGLLSAVAAAVGPAHWTVQALLEAQVDPRLWLAFLA